MGKTTELLPGTLDMLILKAVSLKPLHGYGVLSESSRSRGMRSTSRRARSTRRSIASSTRG